jgi:hypothetical protein
MCWSTYPVSLDHNAVFVWGDLADLVINLPRDHAASKPQLEFDVDARFAVTVVRVRATHIARYQNTDRTAFLDVKQVQDMSTKLRPGPEEQHLSRYQAMLATEKAAKGVYATWIEASVCSAAAEQLLAENQGLALGDEATWTPERLEEEGALDSLLLPSLEMLKRMDSVGHHNRNGLERGKQATCRLSTSTESSPTVVYSFW